MVDDSQTSSGAKGVADQFDNVVIRASAGTGKTYALSNRYLTLLAAGVDCQSILATTFTRKAAGEILDRIIKRLSAAALSESKAEELSQQLKFEIPQPRAAKLLHDILRSLHRLEIGTLDSFFNRVAKAFSLELGLPPRWDIVEEQQMDELRNRAISDVLRDDAVPGMLHLLAKGEVRRSIDRQIYDTVRSVYRIVLETDAEDWNRLPPCDSFLSEAELDGIACLLSAMEVRQKTVQKKIGQLHEIVINGDWKTFADETIVQNVLNGNPTFSRSKLEPPLLGAIDQLIKHCRAIITDRLIKQNTNTYALIEEYRKILEPAKDDTGMLRFDDITGRLKGFVNRPGADRISFRLDQQIRHLLLDEFQDTSPEQWAILQPFARALTAARTADKSFFCVGDMKQAIFGWRGGVAEIFELVERELDNLDESEPLLKSYRSSSAMIDSVNEVFSHVDRYQSANEAVTSAVHSWGRYFSSHSTARNELNGYVAVEMAADATVEQKRNSKSKNGLDWSRNESMYRATVERVVQLNKDLPEEMKIGVLARTNQTVSDLIFRLQQRGISASEEGGNALTDSAAVAIVLSAIQLADHPGDSVARFHVSHSPLASLFGLAPEQDNNQNENLQAAQHGAAQMRLRLVEDGYGPTVEWLARMLMKDCTLRELQRLQHLVRVAYASASDAARWALRPGRFVEFVKEELKVSDRSSARIRVMTIHKSKGLEFDVVVFPVKHSSSGWTGRVSPVVVGRPDPTAPINIASRYASAPDRRFLPDDFQQLFENDRQREIREAMCVLYVGMTRAIHATHVVLTHGAKPEHHSSGGVLMSALGKDRKEGLIYEHGEPRWFENPTTETQTDQVEEAELDRELEKFYFADDQGLPADALPLKERSYRGVPRTSPSRLAGGNSVAVSSLFGAASNEMARRRGTLIHGCFEMIRWLDDGVPATDSVRTHLETIDSTISDKLRDQLADEFAAMLDQESLKNLLTRLPYLSDAVPTFAGSGAKIVPDAYCLEVENECPFAVMLDGGMLEGTIDRLVLVYEGAKIVGADIIDFKTDSVNEKSADEKVEHYRPQLDAYRVGVSAMTGLPEESIGCQLVFVGSGIVKRVKANSGSPAAIFRPDVEVRTRHMPHKPDKSATEHAAEKPSGPKRRLPRGSESQLRLFE